MGNTQRTNNIMNEIIYKNCKRILQMGKQVLIFVHRRAETRSTAFELIDLLRKREQDRYIFESEISYRRKKDVERS